MKCRKRKPKGLCIIHTARIKQIPERAADSDKRVKARKVIDLDESGVCTQGLGTTYLYPANTGDVGHGAEV